MKKLLEAEQEQILADCVADKEAGWEALFHHYHPIAFWVASGPTFRLSKEQSEDVAQVTMTGLCAAIRTGTVRCLPGCVRAFKDWEKPCWSFQGLEEGGKLRRFLSNL